MATGVRDVDLSLIRDPQRPVALVLGLVLIVVGVAGGSGVVDMDVGLGPGLVFGLFGIPLWLAITAVVAGLLGVVLSFYAGAGTTFTKLAGGLVLPAVLFLAITDWGLAVGTLPTMAVGVVTLLLAVVLVAVGVVLLYGHPLVAVLPVVAVLALADLALGLSAMAPASEPVNLPTLGLLVALDLVVLLVGFEGGSRIT